MDVIALSTFDHHGIRRKDSRFPVSESTAQALKAKGLVRFPTDEDEAESSGDSAQTDGNGGDDAGSDQKTDTSKAPTGAGDGKSAGDDKKPGTEKVADKK